MRPAPPWPERLGGPAFVDTRLQAHHVVQLLAAFAGRLLEPREDDGHRSLRWVTADRTLATGSAERTDVPLALVFAPARFSVHLVGGGATETFELEGATLSRARGWMLDRIADAVGGRIELPPPEFEIPAHPVAEGAALSPDPDEAEALARWFDAAAWALEPAAAHPRAGPLRCWPHHFDLATLRTLPGEDDGGRTRTVGAGLTPGDSGEPSPYGYVTPWPYPRDSVLPPLSPGRWHTEGWLGAVLPEASWLGPDGPTAARAFFDEAVAAACALHGAPPRE